MTLVGGVWSVRILTLCLVEASSEGAEEALPIGLRNGEWVEAFQSQVWYVVSDEKP